MKMELEKLSTEAIENYEKENGITPERAQEDVNILKNWILLQPHLPNLPDDEETTNWLRNFLFYCKHRVEKAKQNLEKYFSCRSLVPEFFENRDPAAPEILDNVKALYLVTLPKLTPDGNRIHVFCHAVPDPASYNPDHFMKRALMCLDWKIKEDLTHGDIVILHMKYSSLAHLAKYNFVSLSRFISIVINAYPLRIKAIHITMAPSFIGHVLSNPFITEKMKKRIKVHTENIVTDPGIPSECLPKEVGGALECSLEELNDAQQRRLMSIRDWLIKSESLRSDESKRPPELKTNELFGCQGTFRNLQVD